MRDVCFWRDPPPGGGGFSRKQKETKGKRGSKMAYFLATYILKIYIHLIEYWTAGWKNFGKSSVMNRERVIQKNTVVEIIAQDASILVQHMYQHFFNTKKTSLAAGLRHRPRWGAPPDPLAVMGWDGDLVTTFLGVN